MLIELIPQKLTFVPISDDQDEDPSVVPAPGDLDDDEDLDEDEVSADAADDAAQAPEE